MRNEEGIKIQLQKKVQRKICVRGITFLTARAPFYVIFLALFVSYLFQVTYLLNGPNKDNIARVVICIMPKIGKYLAI